MSLVDDLMDENKPEGSITYYILIKFKYQKDSITRLIWNFNKHVSANLKKLN